MTIITYSRSASKDEMAREIDRRDAVIEALEARAEKAEAERDELAEACVRLTNATKALTEASNAEVARLREALTEALEDCRNSGNGCEIVAERTIDRIEEIIVTALTQQEPKP